jgi:hypothetical protein
LNSTGNGSEVWAVLPVPILSRLLTAIQEIHDIPFPMASDPSMSLAERHTRRLDRRLPKRFRDMLPEPPPALPPSSMLNSSLLQSTLSPQSSIPLPVDHSTQPNSPMNPMRSHFFKYIRTPKNFFGLSHLYFAKQLPTYDPEESVTLTDLCNNPVDKDPISTNQCKSDLRPILPHDTTFHPYPNEASFRLGHWYWSGSVQKSKESFKELLDIITDPDFDPSDIRNTRWDKINATLASNEIEDSEEWKDVDAGWTKKQIAIPVPFHSKTQNPGVHQYIGGELYYRSLVDVIKEKITNQQDCKQFHFEPYELLWKPTDQHQDSRIHGELYTSQSFLEAHRALQDSPGEPGCDLPRVVVGLMFWSDATHLTSFGNAKLWPCYLYFGNESKYRRCKPSCYLCNHVAYFQKVSQYIPSLSMFFLTVIHSYLTSSRILLPGTREAKAHEANFLPIVIASSFTNN